MTWFNFRIRQYFVLLRCYSERFTFNYTWIIPFFYYCYYFFRLDLICPNNNKSILFHATNRSHRKHNVKRRSEASEYYQAGHRPYYIQFTRISWCLWAIICGICSTNPVTLFSAYDEFCWINRIGLPLLRIIQCVNNKTNWCEKCVLLGNCKMLPGEGSLHKTIWSAAISTAHISQWNLICFIWAD